MMMSNVVGCMTCEAGMPLQLGRGREVFTDCGSVSAGGSFIVNERLRDGSAGDRRNHQGIGTRREIAPESASAVTCFVQRIYRVEKKPKKLTQVGAHIARSWILTQEHGSHFQVRKARSSAVYMRRIPIGHRTACYAYDSYMSMELVQAAEQWL